MQLADHDCEVVGLLPSADGGGYAVITAFGLLLAYGDFVSAGDASDLQLHAPVVGAAGCHAGGYWLVATDGGIFGFGGSPFYGSMGGQHLNAPMVGIAGTSTGLGYWTVATDGGIFAYGDAPFYGSMGGRRLNAPIVGIAPTPTGHGYWLVATDGGDLRLRGRRVPRIHGWPTPQLPGRRHGVDALGPGLLAGGRRRRHLRLRGRGL